MTADRQSVATVDAGDFAGWTPIRVYQEGERAMVDWCETGSLRFVAPFFRESVAQVLSRPAAALLRRQTPIELLAEVAAVDPGLAPAGFIFHGSRCGSTLVGQMLAASESNRVLSEPEPVETILRSGLRSPVVAEDVLVARLQALLSVLGRSRGDESRFFVKLQTWNVLALPLIRRAFPEVPWLFCFRHPLEILVSQARAPGTDFVVGPLPAELFGLDLTSAATLPPGVYGAQVLHHLFVAAGRYLDDGGLLVDYAELPGCFGEVLAHFGVVCGEDERALMEGAAAFDAKIPGTPFVADSAAKRAAADEWLRSAATLVEPAYERLVALCHERRPVAVP